MPEITSYKTTVPFLSDYIIGTDIVDPGQAVSSENVTRSYKVSAIVDIILASLNIGTVTSISTGNSTFITGATLNNGVVGPIITAGSMSFSLPTVPSNAGAPASNRVFLRGDNTWSRPGPTPTDIKTDYNGNTITDNTNSIKFTGAGVTASDVNNNVTVDIPGAGTTVDSIIAGAGITINDTIGNVTITNAGVFQVRAGGNVTLSGGTGVVTVSTIKNAGTVVSIAAGSGIANVVNTASNPEIAIDFLTTNNYINSAPTTSVINLNDTIPFGKLTTSFVKTSRLRDIPAAVLTKVKTYIDSNDQNKIKNNESGYNDVAKAKQMVSLTISDYNGLNPGPDPNTLYFIIGAGTSYKTTLSRDTSGITGGGSYNLSTTVNGVAGTSITGPAGTNYTFITNISGSGSTVTGSNMPLTTPGTIPVGNNTITQVLSATVTTNVSPSIRAALVNITFAGSNLGDSGAEGTIWDYAPWTQATGDYKRPVSADPGQAGYFPQNLDPVFGYSSGTSYTYGFNTRIQLLDTNTYQWAAGSASASDAKYLDTGYDGGSWGQTWANGTLTTTIANYQQNVTHVISGTWEYKTIYGSSLVVDVTRIILSGDASGTAPANTYSLSGLSSTTATTSGGATITGARYNETATWSAQTITGTTSYAPGALTYQNSDGSAATLTNTVANPNSTKTVYAVCDIVYTAPAVIQYRKLDVTTYLNSVITGTNYTLTNAVQTGSGSSDSLTYTVPTIVPDTGYILTNGTVTLAANPVTYNVTSFANAGGGTSLANPAIENNPTTPTAASPAVISASTSVVKITNITPQLAFCFIYEIKNNSAQIVFFNWWDCSSNGSQYITLTPGQYQNVTTRAQPQRTGPGTITLVGAAATGNTTTYQATFINSLGDSSGGLNASAPTGTSSAQATLGSGDGNISTSITRISPSLGGGSGYDVYPGRTATIKYYINGNPVQTQTSTTSVSGLSYNFTGVTSNDVVLIEVIEQ